MKEKKKNARYWVVDFMVAPLTHMFVRGCFVATALYLVYTERVQLQLQLLTVYLE